MQILFDITGAIAVIATLLALSRRNPVHALVYLVVSLLSIAIEFYLLGAAFAAALEVIIYAGAIIVLFLFVVMMLPLDHAGSRERLSPAAWIGPGLLAAALLAEVFYGLFAGPGPGGEIVAISPQQVGLALFGPYVIGVELAALLLLSGLAGAFHLSRRAGPAREQEEPNAELEHARAGAGGGAVRGGAGGIAGPP